MNIKNTPPPPPPAAEDEIDLIALAKNLWDGRKIIFKAIVAGAILGLAIALLSSKEYTASTTMVPQVGSENKMNGLSSLAAMAGFNLNLSQGTSELSPYVYPQIVQSIPFQLEIMETPFQFPDADKPLTPFEYYTEIARPGFLSVVKKYTIGLPGIILKALRPGNTQDSLLTTNDSLISLSEDQESVRKIIDNNVSLTTNDKEGYVQLESRFGDPRLAAEVARKAQSLLQQYITEFKIEKARAQLEFIEGRLKEKKTEFEKAQANLAAFRDRNKNVTSAMARTEEERLQNQYQLAFQVYSELAKQFEQAQIKVKEDTPVFSIIKPVTVPVEKSKPKRAMILVIWIFLGGIVGVGIVFGKQFLKSIQKRWKEVGEEA